MRRASAVVVRVEEPDSVDARWCLEEYFWELAARFDAGFDPAKSRSATADELTLPAGCFLLARLHGEPVGCAALKVESRRVGEVKRMWVFPVARGLGIGQRLLASLEQQARELGLQVLRLDTHRTLEEAQALYRQHGYREVAPFNDEPYADHWFEKKLR